MYARIIYKTSTVGHVILTMALASPKNIFYCKRHLQFILMLKIKLMLVLDFESVNLSHRFGQVKIHLPIQIKNDIITIINGLFIINLY